MSSINDHLEQAKNWVQDLRAVIDQTSWPEIDSKPYAQLLCENVIRIIEELDQAEPNWVTGKKRKLCEDDDDQCFSDVSSSNMAMSKSRKNLQQEINASTSNATKSRRVNQKNLQKMLTNLEKAEDDFEWRKYGSKKNENDNYSRMNWFLVEKRKDDDGQKRRKYGSKKIENKNKPILAEYKNLAEETPILNWIVVEKEKSEDGLKWRKCGSKKTKTGNYPRHYYTCAYKGCPAKKQIEQTDDDEHVKISYKKHHNCKNFVPANASGSA